MSFYLMSPSGALAGLDVFLDRVVALILMHHACRCHDECDLCVIQLDLSVEICASILSLKTEGR